MEPRLPINQLAKKVLISREVAEYRIKRLTQNGVIGGAHAVFDVDLIGYRSYRLLLRLGNLGSIEKAELIQHFTDHPHTWWVASTGGRWDIVLNFVAKDQAEFNDIFEELVANFGDYLQAYEILTYISIHDYPRRYILDSKNDEREFFHPMRYDSHVSVDKVDFEIMKLISTEGQLSYTEIGRNIGLTRNAVKSRIHHLEKSKLLLGYRLTYQSSKMGYASYLLLLDINNLKRDRELQLLEFAKQNPNILFVVKHIGKYRLTFECEIEDEQAFHTLLVEVRDKFNDIIVDFDFFPLFFNHKVTYFPLSELSNSIVFR